MNYTYYYFCECGYNQVAHLLQNQKLYQCSSCFNIEGKESQDEFLIHCQSCQYDENIVGDITFEQHKTCTQCEIQGEIGFTKESPFVLKQIPISYENCSKCRKNKWTEVKEELKCPFCFELLKTKMSNYWTDEKEKQENEQLALTPTVNYSEKDVSLEQLEPLWYRSIKAIKNWFKRKK